MPRRTPPPELLAKKTALVIVLLGLILGLIGTLRPLPGDVAGFAAALLRVIGLFVPDYELVANSAEPWALRAAAFICGLSGVTAIFVIWLHSVGQSLGKLWTQIARRNHILLYGDSPMLDALAPVLADTGHTVVRARPHEAGAKPVPEITDLLHGALPLANRMGLNRARAVVVDSGDDAATLSLAKPILAHLEKAKGAKVADLAVAVSDPIISDQLFEIVRRYDLAKRHRILAFDTNSALARGVLAAHPLFPRALARNQGRVHALIVGFGDLGERLLDQVMLTSLAAGLGVPRITVIDTCAPACARRFLARRPAVLEQFQIEFLSLDIGGDALDGPMASDDAKRLAKIEAETPFTGIFLALGQQSDVMRAALLLDRAQDRTGRFQAPIYYRCRIETEAEDLLENARPGFDATRGFIRMSSDPAALVAMVLGDQVSESLARRLHAVYRKGPSVTPEADVPWDDLPETYRRANIRTADHMPAKLWSLGIRIEGDLATWAPTDADRAILTQILNAPADDPRLAELARIEHDRWMIDRRLDGWRPGSPRDNLARIHPLLIPYADLLKQPDEIQKDIEQIKETLRFMGNL